MIKGVFITCLLDSLLVLLLLHEKLNFRRWLRIVRQTRHDDGHIVARATHVDCFVHYAIARVLQVANSPTARTAPASATRRLLSSEFAQWQECPRADMSERA